MGLSSNCSMNPSYIFEARTIQGSWHDLVQTRINSSTADYLLGSDLFVEKEIERPRCRRSWNKYARRLSALLHVETQH